VSDPVTAFDEPTLKTFPATLELLEEQGVLTPTVTLDQLGPFLTAAQRAVADQIMDLDPRDYGVHTPYAGDLEPVPADLVKVVGQQSSDNLDGFKYTVEYAWLRQRGEEFSFYESWPDGNKYGMRAEPWHWQYRSST
jgi:D-alanyl-D-alanine carboxypeptidase